MRKIFNTFAYAAIAALALSSCAKEKLQPADELTGKLVTVHFGTENTDPSTKATLTPDAGETAFQAAWENGDVLSVYYINGNFEDRTVPATWNGSNFSAELPEYTGKWEYKAAYPVPDATDNHVDFGSNRTQKGNAYNSKYDIMVGKAVAKNAAAGKDDSGKDIVFKMDRQTAIAYFHFTSELNEAITSATLKVEGEGAAIASNYAYISDFAWAASDDCNSITITFPEEAPNAQDFQLWFNVLETPYASMSLTVETATKTFTISKSTDGVYEAGKLYKVKKSGIAWTVKGGSVTPSEVTDVITADKLASTGSYTDFSGVKISSNAVYAGNNAMNSGAIQLRSSNSNSGIVSTTSGGKVTKVSVVWASNTANGRTIDIYGNDSPYTNAKELYSTGTNTNQGTKIGSIVCGTSTELVIDGNYPYVGIRSNSGALYLKSVSITWESGSSEPTPGTYSVSCATVTGGKLSATPASAEAGTEISLTATPDAGYVFNNDWTVTAADNSSIKVTEGKFIMPAQDVIVSASFSMAEVTDTYPYAESFDESQGKFTISDVTLPVELTYVWQHSSYNNEGYMKASAYKNKTNYAAESWLISPVIDMSAAVNPVLSFMNAARYGSNENLTLWAREKDGEWSQLSFSEYGTGSDWNFVSNKVDVSAYAGKTLQFAFKYVSTSDGASTWEIKNVEVNEADAAPTLTSIEWTGYTTSYTVGDTFKADGTVTANYSDGSTADVTSESSFSSPDMSTEGTKSVTVTYMDKTTTGSINVKSATAVTKYFVKVTSAPADWSGEYLIVYEAGNVAFDGSRTTLDAVSNTVAVTISDGKIEAKTELLNRTFTIAAGSTSDTYTIQSKSGYYIGQTSNANGLKSDTSTSYDHTLSFTTDGEFTAVSGGAYLRYNATSGQTRFRYFKSGSYTGQKAIQLYKLEN